MVNGFFLLIAMGIKYGILVMVGIKKLMRGKKVLNMNMRMMRRKIGHSTWFYNRGNNTWVWDYKNEYTYSNNNQILEIKVMSQIN
jgi:hypothetical protein